MINEKYELIIENILAKGFSITDDFLSSSEISELLKSFRSRYSDGLFKEAGIGKSDQVKTIASIRGDEILWLETNTEVLAERELLNKNLDFIQYLNRTCFLGIISSEVHFARYGVEKFYKRHLDTFQNQDGRVLSIIYYLNEDWVPADGGYLIIYHQEDGVEKEIRISPKAGRFICFDSTKLEHEVTESFKERLSITGWLKNIP